MKITQVAFYHLDVPFTPHTHEHMQYWLPQWRIVQVCRITLDNGIVGWGETLPHYTHAPVPQDIAERIIGQNPADLLWDDGLGAGVQMALFDAVGRTWHVPCYRLLGRKVREWCPLSWWAMDMPPDDWARQCADAVAQGYTSAKLKARPWFDLHAAFRAVFDAVPRSFTLDIDFNCSLENAANAVKFLKTLEAYEQIAMIETPIPQADILGNRQIRQHVHRPLALHYGDVSDPPAMVFLTSDVVDGFVLCGGASTLLKQAHVSEEANKPFWLQLVGTGITTAWALHLGAVLSHALWPAITCMNIYQSQLLADTIRVTEGFCRVPEEPGLGVTVDESALRRYHTDSTTVEMPRHLYRYTRASGHVTDYACGKQDLRQVYANDAQPVCEAGAILTVVADDGGTEFRRHHAAARRSQRLRPIAKITDAFS